MTTRSQQSSAEIELVEYKDEFKENVISLWGYDKSAVYVRNKRAIWDWQYSDNPYADKISKGLVILEDGEVVAFLGNMPVMLKYGDRVVEAHWTLDGIMNPKCRGRGYGEKMYTKGVRMCKYVHLGIGMNDITEHLVKKAGCVGSDEVQQYVYSSRAEGARGALKKALQRIIVLKKMAKRPEAGDLNVRVVDATRMPAEIDLLWKKVEGEYSKIVVRDYSYMSWKYSRHPLAKYSLILVEEGSEIVGVGVFRKNAAKSRLVDYVGPANDLRIKFLIAEAFKRTCSDSDSLECVCSDKELKTALSFLGFRRYGDIERFYVYSKIEGDQDWEKNWFIMGGESDNDTGDYLAEYGGQEG